MIDISNDFAHTILYLYFLIGNYVQYLDPYLTSYNVVEYKHVLDDCKIFQQLEERTYLFISIEHVLIKYLFSCVICRN